jgi:uncharacterized alkaline shock family protein YloU
VEGRATISGDILARYAADAAREVAGVAGLVESHLPRHRGVRIAEDEGRIAVEIHLAVDWGARIPDVGRAVQDAVAAYLGSMTDLELTAVDVVVDEVKPPAQA